MKKNEKMKKREKREGDHEGEGEEGEGGEGDDEEEEKKKKKAIEREDEDMMRNLKMMVLGVPCYSFFLCLSYLILINKTFSLTHN